VSAVQVAGGQGNGGREPVARLAAVSLLEVLPEIVPKIPPKERELAERTLMAPRLVARDIDLAATLAETGERGFGALIDIDLTHELIGRRVGSRRPTVTIALHVLAAEGTLVRHDDAQWKLDPGAVSA
jgi:CRP-like cAMP-binding protein